MSAANGLSAVFSNLAKAAEKQQLHEVSALFGQVGEHYAVDPKTGSLESLRDLVAEDVDSHYPAINQAATALGDRGVMRALKWGEKVARVQRGVIDRYISKGEELLADQQLFVCEACGFILLGAEPPEICPVCKAPSSRFSVVR